jgi:ribonuclease HI
VTERSRNRVDVERLLDVEPSRLSREALIDLCRDLQRALSANRPPAPVPAQPRSGPSPNRVAGADYTIVFDGGSLGNPGLGYGSYEISGPEGSTTARKLEFGDDMTNNQAEFHALIAGLQTLLETAGQDPQNLSLAVRGDSQLVIRGLKGEWKIKHPGLQPLFNQARNLLSDFGRVDLAWHPRAKSVRTFGH